MFKPTMDVAEKKESRGSKARDLWRQKREEVVFKKRQWAERQAAEAAGAHESQQDATAGAPIVPDKALSNGAADADLNNRIEEIEIDMQQTVEEFKNI
jgi:hypothetical protein